MTHSLQKRLEPARRLCVQAALVVCAGTFVNGAWSSQVAGTGIGRVATAAAPATRPAPAPTTTTPTTVPGKRTTLAPSGASRAGSAATH